MSFYRRYGSLTLVLALHALALICLLLPARAAQRRPAPSPMWLLASTAPAPVSPPSPATAKTPRVVAARRAPQVPPPPLASSASAALMPVAIPATAPATPPAAASVAENLPVATPATAAPAGAPARQPDSPPALTPPAFSAAYLNNPSPAYPPLLRRAGEQGRVLLRVFVNPDGRADEVRILNSSGQSLFDEAAIEAVRKWRFVPARRGETVVAEWVQVPIEFKLG